METKWTGITAVVDNGKATNGTTNQRMLDKSLYDQDECIFKIEAIGRDGICVKTSTADENYKQILHKTNSKIKAIEQ